METLSSSGKSSSSSTNPPWERLEAGQCSWREMDNREQEALVRHYAPKIKFLALRLKAKLPKSVELNELLSAGSLGLMESLGKFRPELGIKFETYSENRIKGAMLDELRRLDWFPRGLRHRVRVLEEVIHKIECEHGVQATEEELSKETGLDPKEVREGLEALQNQLCLSLDAIQDTFSNDSRSHTDNEPYQFTAIQNLVEKVAELIEDLTPREKLVLSLYYGEELNMRETAEVMGITEGRVSQLHSQALSRLRQGFRTRYGDDQAI